MGGPRRLARAYRVPRVREGRLPTERGQSRADVRERKEKSSLERGLDRSPSCGPAGDRLVVRRTYPEELDELARPCVYQ